MKDDLISRQAAIDCEYQVKIINDIEYVMLSEVQMKMRKLPSAQPEIIHCCECQHWKQGELVDKCGLLDCYADADRYCAWAVRERRQDEQTD